MDNMIVTKPDYSQFDIVLVNTSAGKDSQAMLHLVCLQAKEQGCLDKVVAVHSDLGRVEWKGTKALAAEQAAAYGVRFEVAPTRPKGDLLAQIEFERKKFPGGTQARFCTSDHKTSQIMKVVTRLVAEFKAANPKHEGRVRVLNCLGLRSEESSKRAKEPNWIDEQPIWSNATKRKVTRWLPIQTWTTEQVWTTIRLSGVRHHEAYDLGMPRLSCVFCVYANRGALMVAAKHNRELLDEYVRVEAAIGHDFQYNAPIRDIKAAIEAGEEYTGEVAFSGAL